MNCRLAEAAKAGELTIRTRSAFLGPALAFAGVLALAACATDPTPVTAPGGTIARGTPSTSPNAQTTPEAIPVSTGGTARPHLVLEDMTATARQWTIFGRVPTNADVDAELRKRAAELRADAVINVRYGAQGVGAISWSQISGTGQAVRWTDRN